MMNSVITLKLLMGRCVPFPVYPTGELSRSLASDEREKCARYTKRKKMLPEGGQPKTPTSYIPEKTNCRRDTLRPCSDESV